MDFETTEEWLEHVRKLHSKGELVGSIECRHCNVCLKYYNGDWRSHIERMHMGITQRKHYINKDKICPEEQIKNIIQTILNEQYVITKDESDMVSCSEIIKYITKTKGVKLTDTKLGRILNTILETPSKMVKKNGKTVRMRLGIKKKE